jgi:hypothetical protein
MDLMQAHVYDLSKIAILVPKPDKARQMEVFSDVKP